jgi:hypothetical protein
MAVSGRSGLIASSKGLGFLLIDSQTPAEAM